MPRAGLDGLHEVHPGDHHKHPLGIGANRCLADHLRRVEGKVVPVRHVSGTDPGHLRVQAHLDTGLQVVVHLGTLIMTTGFAAAWSSKRTCPSVFVSFPQPPKCGGRILVVPMKLIRGITESTRLAAMPPDAWSTVRDELTAKYSSRIVFPNSISVISYFKPASTIVARIGRQSE